MQSNKTTRSQVEQLEDYHNACMTLTMLVVLSTVFKAGVPALESILLRYVIGPVVRLQFSRTY